MVGAEAGRPGADRLPEERDRLALAAEVVEQVGEIVLGVGDRGVVFPQPAPAPLEDLLEMDLGLGEVFGPTALHQKHREVVATLEGFEMVFTEELTTQCQAAALQRFGLSGLGRIVALDEHDRQVVDALGDVGVKLRIERFAQCQRFAEEDFGGGELPLILEYRRRGSRRSRRHRRVGRRAAPAGEPETPPPARVRGRAGRGCRAVGRAARAALP